MGGNTLQLVTLNQVMLEQESTLYVINENTYVVLRISSS